MNGTPVPVNIFRLIWNSRNQIQRALGDKVRLELIPSVAPFWVNGYRARLKSLLLALALHARQSMPDGGSFLICLRPLDPEEVGRLHLKVTGCNCCEIIFSELGYMSTTMSAEQQATLDRNTVSSVEDIVNQHRGRIRIRQIIHQLPAFMLYLPIAERGVSPADDDGIASGDDLATVSNLAATSDVATTSENQALLARAT